MMVGHNFGVSQMVLVGTGMVSVVLKQHLAVDWTSMKSESLIRVHHYQQTRKRGVVYRT